MPLMFHDDPAFSRQTLRAVNHIADGGADLGKAASTAFASNRMISIPRTGIGPKLPTRCDRSPTMPSLLERGHRLASLCSSCPD